MKDLIKTGLFNFNEIFTEQEKYANKVLRQEELVQEALIVERLVQKTLIKDEVVQDRLEQYANTLLANYCMPSLVRIKPSSLIQINKKRIRYTRQLLEIIEGYVMNYGCSCLSLYEDEHKLSLLIYNRQMLDELLSDKETEYYLLQCGYEMSEDRVGSALNTWQQRYALYFENRAKLLGQEFPHEIGLLLGYPLKDVIGFIQNRGMNYLLCDYWKVYHDRERAVKIFDTYTKVRMNALELLMAGGTLADLSEKLILP